MTYQNGKHSSNEIGLFLDVSRIVNHFDARSLFAKKGGVDPSPSLYARLFCQCCIKTQTMHGTYKLDKSIEKVPGPLIGRV